jgi:hypothetical protein
MKPITAENRTTGSPTYVPLPWHVFAAFWRLVWVGFVVAFGPYSGRGVTRHRNPTIHRPTQRSFTLNNYRLKPVDSYATESRSCG